ncbi:hypothetical protein AB4Z50_01540 [Paenibacillus sp. 2TAB26]|uniref:hypothetical protein n=1 Tax=Paenibacillus sp. 2TAB26 TaxID=3233005 RepID=UPI003F9C35F5
MKRLIYGLFNRLRFNQKLFLSYLIVIIIPIMVLGIYAYNQSKDMLKLQALQGIDKNVNTVTQSIDNSVERYNHAIRSIVFTKMFQKIVANDYIDLVNLSRDLNDFLDPYFIMMMNLDKDIQKITFYTQSTVPEFGDLVVSHKRVSEEPWYNEAMKGIEPLWKYENNELFVVHKFPGNLKERYTNIVYMRINESSFFKNITDLAQEYGVIISDDNSRIVYANQSAKLTAFDFKEIMKLAAMQQDMTGTE